MPGPTAGPYGDAPPADRSVAREPGGSVRGVPAPQRVARYSSRQKLLRRRADDVRRPGFDMLIAKVTTPAGRAVVLPAGRDGSWRPGSTRRCAIAPPLHTGDTPTTGGTRVRADHAGLRPVHP